MKQTISEFFREHLAALVEIKILTLHKAHGGLVVSVKGATPSSLVHYSYQRTAAF